MKSALAKTHNYIALMAGVAALQRRGAPECSFLLVVGEPGLGKSVLLRRYAVESGAMYLRAKATWTKRGLLAELASELGVESKGRNHALELRLIEHLARTPREIVLDEADLAIGKTADLLECIRDITDATESTAILVGTEYLQRTIAGFPQLARRIISVVRFKPLSLEDVTRTCAALAEVNIEPDLVEELHRQSSGLAHLVRNGIANIERFARMSRIDTVARADLDSQRLCEEPSYRRPSRKVA